MIQEALVILADQLNQYIPYSDSPVVELQNIAALDPAGDSVSTYKDKIFLSLVNIAEEATLRNGPDYQIDKNNEVQYHNWPVHVNLFLLFACPSELSDGNYKNSLGRLSRVVEFFQGNREFTTPELTLPAELASRSELLNIKLSMDLHTLTFEQVNDLWGSLGGRQFPFVMYKCRLVKLEMKRPRGEGAAITEIVQPLNHLYP